MKAVAGRCEVFLDGGVRTGTDVLKAVALGAKAVFIGRPALYALSYNVSECPRLGRDYFRIVSVFVIKLILNAKYHRI